MQAAPLRVVTAFESAGRFGDRYSIPIPVSDEEIARREEVATRKMVDEVLGAAESPPEVRIVVMAGATGPTLVEESRTAELLVVGHRGRGELASVLLGIGRAVLRPARALAGVGRPAAHGYVGSRGRAHHGREDPHHLGLVGAHDLVNCRPHARSGRPSNNSEDR